MSATPENGEPILFRVVAFGTRDKDKLYTVELFSRIFEHEQDARTFGKALLAAEGTIHGIVDSYVFQKIRIEEQSSHALIKFVDLADQNPPPTCRQILEACPDNRPFTEQDMNHVRKIITDAIAPTCPKKYLFNQETADAINELQPLNQAEENKLQERLKGYLETTAIKPSDFGRPKTATEHLEEQDHFKRSYRKTMDQISQGYPTYAEIIASPDPAQLLADYAAKRAARLEDEEVSRAGKIRHIKVPTLTHDEEKNTLYMSGPVTPEPYTYPITDVIEEIPVRGKITKLPGTSQVKQDASEQNDFDPNSPSIA